MTPEWMKPYYESYCDFYGQAPPRGHYIQMLKLREHDASYGADCLAAWMTYMKHTDLKYFSVRHFLNTYNVWESPAVTKSDAMRRAFNAGLRGVDDKSIPVGGFQTEKDFKAWLMKALAAQDEAG